MIGLSYIILTAQEVALEEAAHPNRINLKVIVEDDLRLSISSSFSLLLVGSEIAVDEVGGDVEEDGVKELATNSLIDIPLGGDVIKE